MPKITFTKLPDPHNEFDRTKVQFEVDHECLPEIIQSFEDFLRGCGFHMEPESLQIVTKDEE